MAVKRHFDALRGLLNGVPTGEKKANANLCVAAGVTDLAETC
jgi:hypothetical protein